MGDYRCSSCGLEYRRGGAEHAKVGRGALRLQPVGVICTRRSLDVIVRICRCARCTAPGEKVFIDYLAQEVAVDLVDSRRASAIEVELYVVR